MAPENSVEGSNAIAATADIGLRRDQIHEEPDTRCRTGRTGAGRRVISEMLARGAIWTNTAERDAALYLADPTATQSAVGQLDVLSDSLGSPTGTRLTAIVRRKRTAGGLSLVLGGNALSVTPDATPAKETYPRKRRLSV